MLQAVTRVVRAEHVDVVLPVTDAASRVLLGQDHVLGARVAGPSAAAYQRASDKQRLLEMAPQFGIRVPRQIVLGSADLVASVIERLEGAWVLKPARSVVDVEGQAHSLQVSFASSPAAIPALVSAYPEAAYPLLIQERIVGTGVGIFLLRNGGKTVLSFGHRRLREKPPAGGVSTFREAVVPDVELVRKCEALLDALGYEGPAMIEFKEDERGGEPVLMEINARLWGSLQLAIDAGLDFPGALVALAAQQPIPAPAVVRPGVRSYWELGELDHALAIWRKSPEALAVGPSFQVGARSALRALCDRRWTDRAEVFRFSDPAPFLVELYHWIRRR